MVPKELFTFTFLILYTFTFLFLYTNLSAEATIVDNFEVDANGKVRHSEEEIQIEENVDSTPPLVEFEEEDECGLYLAPSTIDGGGLGIFTTRPLAIGDYIGQGDVVIPMVEVPFYNGNKPDLYNPFVHYYWKGSEKGLHGIVADGRDHEVQAFVPGLDAAVNCNLALLNVDNSGAEYDNCDLNRNKDPMAGGMTPYFSTSSQVTRPVPAGGELFKFYGDQWFIGRTEKFGLIPLSDDYPQAQTLVNKFNQIRKEHFESNAELGEELWDLSRYFIGSLMWESRVMNALPYMYDDAKKAAEDGIASLHQPNAIRSNEFLRQHGKCMDSIRPGKSTLPSKQGGRGAFATRNFSRGTIITGTPLHHIDKELLTIFEMELDHTNSTTGEEIWLRHTEKVVGYQMMLNYCYGHPESTLLLCPYGSSIGYINHNKSRANVKIQWAQDLVTKHDQSWVDLFAYEDLMREQRIGLAFDFVAIRDIQEGEELFLDYGDEFEEALNKHMEQWQPPRQQIPNYTPAELFEREVSNLPLRTIEEQQMEPYPENLQMRCHGGLVYSYLKSDDQFTTWETRERGFPCRILERYPNISTGNESGENNFLYKVEMKVPLEEVGRQYRRDAFNYFQKSDVSRTAIKFFNKPYTTDLSLPNTFRKEIGIPDKMFPERWRNGPAIKPQDESRDEGPRAPYRNLGEAIF